MARRANAAAQRLAIGLEPVPGVRIVRPTQANEVFAILPRDLDARLRAGGCYYYEWNPQSLPSGDSVNSDEVFVRLVASFATTEDEVDQFLALAAQHMP
jgi:threonine aldolase